MKLKIKNLITIATASILVTYTLLAWRGIASETTAAQRLVDSATRVAGQGQSELSSQGVESTGSASREILESARTEIMARAGTTSCLEVSEPGDTGIDEAYDAGIIVDATLEEVETALLAAAATPGFEDDIAAQRLAHRGSYRYFYRSPDSGSEKTSKP